MLSLERNTSFIRQPKRQAGGVAACPSRAPRQLAAHPRADSAAGATGEQAAATSSLEQRLINRRCEPCEASLDAEDAMGFRSSFDPATAERYMSHLESGWKLWRDDQGHLRIRRRLRTKNFVKGLELFQRIGVVAEQEGHHPDLYLESWNVITVGLWTHERKGLTENDFIVAAKIDAIEKADLISKKPPPDF